MNNKQLGTEFEQEFCKMLSSRGYWVHFIVPDARGAQPFDVIAVKNKKPYAFECKTLSKDKASFPLSRLEDNQILACDKWIRCGNGTPMIAIKQGDEVYIVEYIVLRMQKSVKIKDLRRLT